MKNIFEKQPATAPTYKFVSRNYDVPMPHHLLANGLPENIATPEPLVPCLSCIRMKKGSTISIKLVLRFHAAE